MEKVAEHYEISGISDRIRDALMHTGIGDKPVTPDDLAPVDQFHIGGKEAAIELAEMAGFQSDHRILDVGCGIGGPARLLASTIGCHVVGIDFAHQFITAARMLTEWTYLTHLVSFIEGNAKNMPFEEAEFDGVWMEHVSMNIEDKPKLFADIFRVLKPGGVLAVHEVLAASELPAYYPAPWAPDEETSFLIGPKALCRAAKGAGFEIEAWQDKTEDSRKFFDKFYANIDEYGTPTMGLHTLMGPRFSELGRNVLRSLQDERIWVIQAKLVKPWQ